MKGDTKRNAWLSVSFLFRTEWVGPKLVWGTKMGFPPGFIRDRSLLFIELGFLQIKISYFNARLVDLGGAWRTV